MQVSYTILGDDGHHAAAQLEARVRHDAQDANPATVKLLEGVTGYVRQAVEGATDAVVVEVDITIRARKNSFTATAHLAPAEGNPGAPTDAEGSEAGEIDGIIRSLSLVTDADAQPPLTEEQLRAIEDQQRILAEQDGGSTTGGAAGGAS